MFDRLDPKSKVTRMVLAFRNTMAVEGVEMTPAEAAVNYSAITALYGQRHEMPPAKGVENLKEVAGPLFRPALCLDIVERLTSERDRQS